MTTSEQDDRQAVVAMVRELGALSDWEFKEALADNLVDPNPVETRAFRARPLVERTLRAATALVNETNAYIRQDEGESAKALNRRRIRFREAAGIERRTCQDVINGLRAADPNYRPSNAPSAHSRAQKELQERHIEEFLALKRKHKEIIKQENKAAREARKRARTGK